MAPMQPPPLMAQSRLRKSPSMPSLPTSRGGSGPMAGRNAVHENIPAVPDIPDVYRKQGYIATPTAFSSFRSSNTAEAADRDAELRTERLPTSAFSPDTEDELPPPKKETFMAKIKRAVSRGNLKATSDKPPQLPKLPFEMSNDQAIDIGWTDKQEQRPRQRSKSTAADMPPPAMQRRVVTAPMPPTNEVTTAPPPPRVPSTDPTGTRSRKFTVVPAQRRNIYPVAQAIKEDGPVAYKGAPTSISHTANETNDSKHFVKKKSFYTRPAPETSEGGVMDETSPPMAGLGIFTGNTARGESVILPTQEMVDYLKSDQHTNGPPSPTASEAILDDDASRYSGDTMIGRPSTEPSSSTIALRRQPTRMPTLGQITQNALDRKARAQPLTERELTLRFADEQQPSLRPAPVNRSQLQVSPTPTRERIDSGVDVDLGGQQSPQQALRPQLPSFPEPKAIHPAFRTPSQRAAAFQGKSSYQPPVLTLPSDNPFTTPRHPKQSAKQDQEQPMSPTPEQFDSVIDQWNRAGTDSSPSDTGTIASPAAAASPTPHIPAEKLPVAGLRIASKGFSSAQPRPKPKEPASAGSQVSGLGIFKNVMDADKYPSDTYKIAVPPPPTAPPKKPLPLPGVDEDYQQLRREVGQPYVRPRDDMFRKHPNHPHAWYTNNIMCKDKHTDPSNRNITQCSKCPEYCCYYAELISQPSKARDQAMKEVLKARADKIEKLEAKTPAGIETYSALMICVSKDCQKIVCPDHADICDYKDRLGRTCVLPVCEDCAEGLNAHQHMHRFY